MKGIQDIYNLFFSGTAEQAAKMDHARGYLLIVADVGHALAEDPNLKGYDDDAPALLYYTMGRADEMRARMEAERTKPSGPAPTPTSDKPEN